MVAAILTFPIDMKMAIHVQFIICGVGSLASGKIFQNFHSVLCYAIFSSVIIKNAGILFIDILRICTNFAISIIFEFGQLIFLSIFEVLDNNPWHLNITGSLLQLFLIASVLISSKAITILLL